MSPFYKTAPKPSLDSSLIGKYNNPVPRYTSYPTALKFCVIDDLESGRAMYMNAGEKGPLSLYFHLPFCHSLCWFCGCTKIISSNQACADRYIDYLEKEIALVRPTIAPGRKVIQLHFGGGSPNFLTPKQIDRLSDLIHGNFDFEEQAEMSVELDPRTLTLEKVQAFQRMGINRASIGVQDVNPKVQKAIHRIQPSETNRETIAWLKEAGIEELNVDLIYGLPYQSPKSFSRTLDEVLTYDPDRFALFSYAHIPSSIPSQRIIEKSPLPSPDEKIDMLTLAMDRFKEAGYVHIGMDHFTKPTDDLAKAQATKTLQRNFQGYSTHSNTQICSFGISAISQTKRTFRQNVKELDRYYQSLDAGIFPIERGYVLNEDDQIRRHVIMRLMCDMELDFEDIGNALNIDFCSYFKNELNGLGSLEADGLLTLTPKKLIVSSLGRLLIRNIACLFDAYYGNQKNQFSKAV
jgi:oxygen-independent coproporphyrinogen III oxidase